MAEKMEALDFLINVLREHEKTLDQQIKTLDQLVANAHVCPVCRYGEPKEILLEDAHLVFDHSKKVSKMDQYTIFKCPRCATVWAEGVIILARGEL